MVIVIGSYGAHREFRATSVRRRPARLGKQVAPGVVGVLIPPAIGARRGRVGPISGDSIALDVALVGSETKRGGPRLALFETGEPRPPTPVGFGRAAFPALTKRPAALGVVAKSRGAAPLLAPYHLALGQRVGQRRPQATTRRPTL